MLETIDKYTYVTFDPNNLSHIMAYYNLHYLGKQTDLRFKLEKPFLDIPAMMQHKLAETYLKIMIDGLNFRY